MDLEDGGEAGDSIQQQSDRAEALELHLAKATTTSINGNADTFP